MSDEIADRLKKIRKIYGLSQRELAKRAGVTNSSISMIEQGRVSPSLSSLEKLLNGIPMKLKDFFSIDFNDDVDCFFRHSQMLLSSDQNIDYYRLLEQSNSSGQLSYEVHNAGADTGKAMRVDVGRSYGFVVQGRLNIMINSQLDNLEVGDGFIIAAGHPYRFRNLTDQCAVVVIYRALL